MLMNYSINCFVKPFSLLAGTCLGRRWFKIYIAGLALIGFGATGVRPTNDLSDTKRETPFLKSVANAACELTALATMQMKMPKTNETEIADQRRLERLQKNLCTQNAKKQERQAEFAESIQRQGEKALKEAELHGPVKYIEYKSGPDDQWQRMDPRFAAEWLLNLVEEARKQPGFEEREGTIEQLTELRRIEMENIEKQAEAQKEIIANQQEQERLKQEKERLAMREHSKRMNIEAGEREKYKQKHQRISENTSKALDQATKNFEEHHQQKIEAHEKQSPKAAQLTINSSSDPCSVSTSSLKDPEAECLQEGSTTELKKQPGAKAFLGDVTRETTNMAIGAVVITAALLVAAYFALRKKSIDKTKPAPYAGAE